MNSPNIFITINRTRVATAILSTKIIDHLKMVRTYMGADWVKTITAIIIQTAAFAFFLAGMKSDLNHLNENFLEFKTKMEREVERLNVTFSEMAQVKVQIGTTIDSLQRETRRLDAFEVKFQDVRDKVLDQERVIKIYQRDPNTK